MRGGERSGRSAPEPQAGDVERGPESAPRRGPGYGRFAPFARPPSPPPIPLSVSSFPAFAEGPEITAILLPIRPV